MSLSGMGLLPAGDFYNGRLQEKRATSKET
jgi:hypothetical protein